jgi:hypothetical protein
VSEADESPILRWFADGDTIPVDELPAAEGGELWSHILEIGLSGVSFNVPVLGLGKYDVSVTDPSGRTAVAAGSDASVGPVTPDQCSWRLADKVYLQPEDGFSLREGDSARLTWSVTFDGSLTSDGRPFESTGDVAFVATYVAW